jgi:hypothetical protein
VFRKTQKGRGAEYQDETFREEGERDTHANVANRINVSEHRRGNAIIL